MKRPENFDKIDNEIIKIGIVDCRIDVSKNGFFVFGDNKWDNAILFEMNWDKNQYNVKICVLGEGVTGWYLHQDLPIPKSLMKTLTDFKEFVKSNILDVASKVDLTNIEYYRAGATNLYAETVFYEVLSSDGVTKYKVANLNDGITNEWSCSCPAFVYSKETPRTCKHIKSVKN